MSAQEIGHPYTDTDFFISPAKLNAMSVIIADANFLNSMGSTVAGQCVRCIGTIESGIFKPDRTYFRNSENNAWDPDTGFRHLHNIDEDESGGLFRDILLANISDYLIADMNFPVSDMFHKTFSGTGSVNDFLVSMTLATGTLTEDFVQTNLQGGSLTFQHPSAFCIRSSTETGADMAVKYGVGMVGVMDDEPIDARYGLESCDVESQERNYNIISGDGTSWTLEPTSEPVAQATHKGYKIQHDPGDSVEFSRFDSANQEIITRKTSDVPVSGDLLPGRIFKLGIKTNESAAKYFHLNGFRVVGKMRDYYWPPTPAT